MTFRIDTLATTPEIFALIAEIDEFKAALRAIGTLAPRGDHRKHQLFHSHRGREAQ
ncbi:hypothetical protein GGD81_004169 [Rhodobium orientis]|uniref:hypothetical protein n=1 Tax=Rhodobium orientis TaxID=34017 RepID=UPI001824FBDE|nr:hypothetical protein [Rhodobium orientis]MBB4305101.1 hypothetical protein [Rhodobium orientis]